MDAPGKVGAKLKAICSVPRLGFNDHFGSMNDTLAQFKIPIGWYTGAYWNQCIETALEDCIDHVDWILALDYDTLATPQHLHRMLETFAAHPEIDALAANQPKRHNDEPLWTIANRKGLSRIETHGETIKAATAHFGFTLFRAEKFKTLSKPWFSAKPSETGKWEGKDAGYGTPFEGRFSSWRGDDHLDADINFWRKWENEGRTLHIEQSVCIGHIEAMVSFYEQRENKELGALELVKTYISCSEWRKRYSKEGGMCSLGER